MSHIGEFELIRRISARFQSPPFSNPEQGEASSGVVGIGDDCAVLPQHDGLDTLVTTDLLIEDRHFLLSDISPEDLGWKSAAVNISDIAAMGGRPTGAFLSIALPGSMHAMSTWVERFIDGFGALCSRFGVPLLGGDTSASPDKLFINVTVLGECPHGAARLRSDARPGDLVCVTGTLGDSAAGLRLVLDRAGVSQVLQSKVAPGAKKAENAAGTTSKCYTCSTQDEILVSRHYRPVPRVAEGQALAATDGVHAMMDVSDGIASDLRHILKASSGQSAVLGAEIDLPAVPLSEELTAVAAASGWDPAELAVSGGEDYELLFTVAPEALPAAAEAVRIASGGTVRVSAIGRIVLGSSEASPLIRWIGGSKQDYQGFSHF